MLKNTISNLFSNRMSVIWYNWIIIQVLVFAFTISCFAAASDSESKGYGFMAIWTMMLTLAFSVGGTPILRQVERRTPLAIGFMIGVGFMQIQIMLMLASISGADLATFGRGPAPSSEDAVQAFAVMLMMAYGTFTTFVILWRDTLLPAPSLSSQDQSETGYPPAASTYGASGSATYEGGGVAASYHDEVPATGGEASSVL